MRRLLITCAGSDVAVAVIKCIASGLPDVKIFACDIKQYVPNMKCFERYFTVPRYDSKEFRAVIQSIMLAHKITDFLPVSEPEIIFFDKRRDFFLQNNIRLIINNGKIIQIATSKYKTALFLKENGLKAPNTFLPDKLPQELDYPVIIKPDFGRGGTGICIATNKEELDAALKTVVNPVVQQYVGSDEDEYTIGVFSDGTNIYSIVFKRKLGYGSMSVFVETVNDNKLSDMALLCAKIFNLQGSINIQARYFKGEYFIFEVNPRLSSTVRFRHLLGFQDAVWWLKMLNNEQINFNENIGSGIIGIKTFEEEIIYPPPRKSRKRSGFVILSISCRRRRAV